MVGDGHFTWRDASSEIADGGCVATAIVVEDDDDSLPAVTDVVQRLVGHAAGHAAVADDRDDVAMRVGTGVARDRHPVGVGQHRAGVTVLDVVVRAFLTVRVAGQTVCLAQLLELCLTPGHDLVDVRLVAGIPQNRVGGRLEHTVQGQCQLDGAEVAAEMTGVFGDRLHDEVAYLAGEVVQLRVAQLAKVGRLPYLLQGHGDSTLPLLVTHSGIKET